MKRQRRFILSTRSGFAALAMAAVFVSPMAFAQGQASTVTALTPDSKLSDQQLHQLCQAAIAKHASPGDVESLGRPMGLSPEQIAQLKECVGNGAPAAAAVTEDH